MNIQFQNDLFGKAGFGGVGQGNGVKEGSAVSGQKNGSLTINAANAFGKSQAMGSLEQRKAMARKQAMHIVSEAFKGELDLDKTVQGLGDEVARLKESIREKEGEQSAIEQRLSELQKEYGIDPEGEEQKKLEAVAAKMVMSKDGISEEERSGLTEYQQKALDSMGKHHVNDMDLDLEKELMKANISGIRQIRLERLKSDPVGEAEKEGEELMDAANEEAVHGLFQEGKEHLDEVQEEQKEKAEEKAKEKKEEDLREAERMEKEALQEELVREIREGAGDSGTAEVKRAAASRKRSEGELEELIGNTAVNASDISEMETLQSAVSSEVTNILNKLSLLSEDVKGAALDNKL